MIRMPPAVAEPGSAARSRVRFQELVPAAPAADANSTDEPVKQGSGVDRQGFELQEDPSFWKDHNVQVVIRIRPLSSSEISLQGYNRCVRQDSCQTLTWTGHPESRFTFDIVADEHVSQEKLFKVAGVPMIENCVAGYNSCMFAYGQTGSGKTHTMLGDIESGTRRHSVNAGMTPRVFEYLFSRIQKEKDTRRDEKLRFTCRCSFLEIYNEQILDLLDPSSFNLQIREDAKKGVYVENLTEFEVSSARDVMQQLVQGAANRKVAATNMNRASSRSHSVFTCVIESKWESQGVVHHRFSRLNLVDLAGSERQKSSGAEGDRLKEATNINKSLSTLGLVIMNLVSISNKKSSLHVPYRDSKLTFLLQDSLGGNSKTIIIANISPSNCCALETLSTLKFAQRAKYIRNNAIINEDASGDILAMRLQIQQLKKEVSRLRGLVNGGLDIQESDAFNTNFPVSPAIFKWDGEQGSFSPLTYDKRLSQRKEYEAALVAAFKRDQEKEVAFKALVAEKQAIEQLAGQRTEEVQGLKMRLRFREEGIRRLEAVASGKLASETHLLQEREELVKEIEILRNQVDRNPEITRFAMENLRLKEELRRLQLFVEEGEREMMNEQITVLQDKLLEALDWKLMHENEKTRDVAQDLSLSWESSVNEENEFLRLQAIQNQREVDALRKNLNFCLEAKEKLERRVDELLFQIEEQKNFVDAQAGTTHQLQISSPVASRTNVSSDDQIELKTMVDAIAAASQREAEAHETAIILAKENEELRAKLKVLIEDNNKLIELYEGAVAEGAKVVSVPEIVNTGENCNASEDLTGEGHEYFSHDEYFKETKDVEDLERQLQEMHEENEKLLGLYENAMQERDEFKRRLSSNELKPPAKEEINCPEKLVEVYEERNCQNMKVVEEPEEYAKSVKISDQNLQFAETRLDTIQCKLITAAESVQFLGLLEMETIKADELSKEVEVVVCNVQSKQQQVTKLKYDLSRIHENKAIIDNKFVALKSALQSFSSNDYWEGRLKRARARVDACRVPLDQRKEELRHLQIQKEEADAACMKSMQCEAELRNNIDCLKSKFQDAETQRKESERILFSIENLNNPDAQGAMSFGKASELLKSEEERTKLSAEMKQLQDKLATVQKEIANSKKVSKNIYVKIQSQEEEVKNGLTSLEEAEVGLRKVAGENEMLKEMREEGRRELDRIILDYQACIFESCLKEEEINMCEEALRETSKKLENLQNKRMVAAQRLSCLLEENRPKLLLSTPSGCAQFVSQNLEQELEDASRCVTEARSLFIC